MHQIAAANPSSINSKACYWQGTIVMLPEAYICHWLTWSCISREYFICIYQLRLCQVAGKILLKSQAAYVIKTSAFHIDFAASRLAVNASRYM